MPMPSVPAAARRQGGVFTAEQARQVGWTTGQVRWWLGKGVLRRVVGAGLVPSDHPDPVGAVALAWAATLTWPEVVVGHRVAAAWHGFPVTIDPAVVDVFTDRPRTRSYRALLPHRVSLPEKDVMRRCGPAVTAERRTIGDCLAFLPEAEALSLYAWLVTRSRIRPGELSAEVRDRLGCRGSGNS